MNGLLKLVIDEYNINTNEFYDLTPSFQFEKIIDNQVIIDILDKLIDPHKDTYKILDENEIRKKYSIIDEDLTILNQFVSLIKQDSKIICYAYGINANTKKGEQISIPLEGGLENEVYKVLDSIQYAKKKDGANGKIRIYTN